MLLKDFYFRRDRERRAQTWSKLGVIKASACLCIWLSCPMLCDCIDCSPLGSSVHGIFQARILEWVD